MEKELVEERAEAECCEASFYWIKQRLDAENISL
jgi:hypothetical protein